MTLTINNIHPVNLDASIDSAGGLALAHGSDLLSDHSNSLFNELPEDGDGPYDDAEIIIADFVHNSVTHEVHVWEDDPAGLVKWSRQSGTTRSGARDHLVETEILVVAVPDGVSVPSPSSTSGPPAPGTTQSTVKVKIVKQGSMPF